MLCIIMYDILLKNAGKRMIVLHFTEILKFHQEL